jgi:hypothetical protein
MLECIAAYSTTSVVVFVSAVHGDDAIVVVKRKYNRSTFFQVQVIGGSNNRQMNC